MNPESAATVARLRLHLSQLRAAVRAAHELHESTVEERDAAVRERWSLQKEVAAGKRAAEGYEALQAAQKDAQRREETLRGGLREILKDLTALSRYLQP